MTFTISKLGGHGTSMVTLALSPNDVISKNAKMLDSELGTASNIKSRVNRQSVENAIVSAREKLKQYSKVPPNGLMIFVGTVNDKKISISLEPPKPICSSFYRCDSKFHTHLLSDLLVDDKSYGFIIVDGNGCLFGTVCGNTKQILYSFSVQLPKKHGRGGQSSVRFSRLRVEARNAYMKKVGEHASTIFLKQDTPIVCGIIIAGIADLKNELLKNDLLDYRLSPLVLATLDISYGGENGFHEAIQLSEKILKNVVLEKERKILHTYYNEISRDTNKYCFGVRDLMIALEAGACEKILIWDKLEVSKPLGSEEKSEEPTSFLDWILEKYSSFGTTVQLITDATAEGSQFIKGFGGIGGLLRYPYKFEHVIEEIHEEDDMADFI